jgi:hypothetical protein
VPVTAYFSQSALMRATFIAVLLLLPLSCVVFAAPAVSEDTIVGPAAALPGRPRQEFALNLSAKRRLCNTVGGRFIDGTTCCCAVSTARSRAATMTNFARSSLVLVLRAFFGGAKSCALVNFHDLPPVGWVTSPPRPNSCPRIPAISWL